MARTEVRGSLHEGEILSSIGAHRGRGKAADAWPGNNNNDGSYESQCTRTRGRNPQLDRRPLKARRSERHNNSDGNKNSDCSNGSQRIRTKRRNPQFDRRPSGARRTAAAWPGNNNNGGLYESQSIRTQGGGASARSAPIEGAAKRAPHGRATGKSMARTEF